MTVNKDNIYHIAIQIKNIAHYISYYTQHFVSAVKDKLKLYTEAVPYLDSAAPLYIKGADGSNIEILKSPREDDIA